MPRPNVDPSFLPPPRPRRSGRFRGRSKAPTSFSMRRAPTPPDSSGSLKEAKDVLVPVVKENWQPDAYAFAEAIGELGYALNLKANTLAECRLRAEVRIPGTDEWEETDDPRVLRVIGAFQPPQGDQGELLRQAALHYEIAGETYLFGQPIHDEHDRPAGLLWEFLSTLEIRVEADGRVVRNAWGGSRGRKEVPVDAYVARLHHRDPRYSERADCPVRRILPICRELVLLTQVIDAVAKSRLPAGILYIPWEISNGTPDDWDDPGNPDTGFDEMEEELSRHLNAPIEDRTAASSLDPLLMRGPAMIKDKPTKDMIGVINLSRDLDGVYKELRQEALIRLAGGLDIPPEVISGKSHASHWNAYAIDSDFISKHIIPLGRTVTDFLTTSYLRPMLTIFEQMLPIEADWFRLALDTSPITAETDRSDNATIGVQLEIVSDEAWLRANGLDDKDLAEPEERKRRSLERLLYAQPTLGPAILPVLYPNDPQIQAAVANWNVGQSAPGGAVNPQAPPVIGPPMKQPALPPVPSPNHPPASPSSGAEPDQPRLSTISDTLLVAILASADRELDHALERGAERLISRIAAGIDPEEAKKLRATKRTETLTVAGTAWATKAGLHSDHLFAGCWDELAERVVGWLRNDLVTRGVQPYAAERGAVVAAAELVTNLHLLAASSLTGIIPIGPDGFKVPTDLVLAALAAGDLARSI